jgi:chromosome segregation ATPase
MEQMRNYTQKLYNNYVLDKKTLVPDQSSIEFIEWLADKVYDNEVRIEVLRNGFRHQVEALETLQEMTGSQNDRNPWLGITASVAQLQIRIDDLTKEIEKSRDTQQGMIETISNARAREAEHDANFTATRETLRKVNIALIESEADKEKLHDTIMEHSAEKRAYEQVVTSLNAWIDETVKYGLFLIGHINDATKYDNEPHVCHLSDEIEGEIHKFTQQLHSGMDHEIDED